MATNNNAPAITTGPRTPISNVGSGSSTLQNPNISERTQGSGGDFIIPSVLGGLAGTVVGNLLGSNPAAAVKNAVQRPPAGGSTSMPTGNLGSVNKVLLPPGSTQTDVNATYGMSNGQPNYVVSGVDMGSGKVIATPNYDTIGGTNLTGLGSFGATSSAAAPVDQTAGTYFQDSYGNIYDGEGNLYAVKSGDSYFVADESTPNTWTNYDTGTTIDTNTLFGGEGGGYDPLQEPYDNEQYFSGPDLDYLNYINSDYSPGYDPYTDFYDNEEYFSGPDLDYLNYIYGDYKNGGMATPLMAKGGKVQADGVHMNQGGALSAITTLLGSGGVQGALVGALLSELMGGSSAGGVNKGVDMSKVGVIPARTTDFGMGPANYVPQTAYSPIRTPTNQYSQRNADLGVSGSMPTFSPLNFLGRNPLKRAEGGMVNEPKSYYTFGKEVNALDNMMAEGGSPLNTNVPALGGMHQNTHVPVMHGRKDYRKGAAVEGPGDGQSDDIPAMLADGEYVIDADVVAALGNGSNKAGSKVLDEFRENIRKHKRSADLDKIPPKAKSPLAYLKGAK